ncbi:MAG: hypothetical protein DHS20C15_25490 [Planctomycetota bacterium]|nr:MAG: hypothetical protein DHS20C15_25490 [Planctomycetota bacterium]
MIRTALATLALLSASLSAQDANHGERVAGAATGEAAAHDSAAPDPLADEAHYYSVEHYTPPEGAVLEVGGMDWFADGRLALSTRRGQVWIVENALADDIADARFTLFAEGLHEGLGLRVLPTDDGGERLLVLQRGELTELQDRDGDGRADTFLTLSSDWGTSGNYHEFAFGLPSLPDGRLAMSLNVSFFSPKWWLGQSPVKWRGWALAVDIDTGEVEPIASGFRSPCGVTTLRDGRLLITDNQGDWMPACAVFSVKPGAFHSHPGSLNWTDEYQRNRVRVSDTIPPDIERAEPALWLPYGWSRSTGNLVEDTSDGAFGPFADQLVIAELTNGLLLRGQLETIEGVEQGAVFMLRQSVGSSARVLQASDGTLLTGFTNRGWGGLAPDDGLARVRWTGVTPLEIANMHAIEDGFLLRFTDAVSQASADALTNDALALTQFDYDWWWEYGSPERHTTAVPVESLAWNAARTELRLHAPALQPGFMARVILPELRTDDGRPLLHDEAAYTLNRMPGRPAPEFPIAKEVEPPPPKTSADEGWLRLTYGDALNAWEQSGWELVDANWDVRTPRTLQISPGVNALVNTARDASDYRARWDFGEGSYHVEFLLTEGSALSAQFGDELRVELTDGERGNNAHFGRVHTNAMTHAPTIATYQGPGRWHTLDVHLRADRIERVLINDVEIHQGIALPEGADPLAGFTLAPAHGMVALRTLRYRGLDTKPAGDDWLPLFNGEDLGEWRIAPVPTDAEEPGWEIEDGELLSYGPSSLLLSSRDDYTNFELSAQVRVNDQGDGGLILRANEHGEGYEVQINASLPTPNKTGSLLGALTQSVSVELVPPGTWCWLRARVEDLDNGTRVRIWVNEVLVVDALDEQRTHAVGRIALQQHHDGGLVRVRELRVRELDD